MVKLIIGYILIFFLLTIPSGCKMQLTHKEYTPSNEYKIKKIVEHDMFYIIYARRNDSIFKIVQDKKVFLDDSVNYEKIHRGGMYKLILENFYKRDIELGIRYAYVRATLNYFFVPVPVTKKTHYELYVATNLDGLFLRLPQEAKREY